MPVDPVLDAQRRCLDACFEAWAERPRIHAHQLLALRRERALADDARDIAGYRRRSGDGFELLRAAELDRLAGSMAVAESVGDVHAVEASRIGYRSALEATGAADWPRQLCSGARLAADARERSDLASGSCARCVLNLLAAQSGEPQLADHHGAARDAWRTFAAADPLAAQAAAQQPQALDRLALRLPWRGVGLSLISDWLAALPAAAPPAPADPADLASLDPHLPTAQWMAQQQAAWLACWQRGPTGDVALAPLPDARTLLAPYRQMADAPATPAPSAAAARRALACGADAPVAPELLRRLTADRIPAAIAAAAGVPELDAIEARQLQWHEPLLARHARSLRAALLEVRSLTEVELVTGHADACLAIEADWNRLLMASLLAPLHAAALVAVFGTEAVPGLHRAARMAHALLGLGPRALLQSPALATDLADRLLPALRQGGEHGSRFGEAGRELLAPLHGWAAAVGSRGAGAWADARSLASACIDVLDRHAVAEPPPVACELRLWRRTGSAAQPDRLIATSSRPPIPGWGAAADPPAPL